MPISDNHDVVLVPLYWGDMCATSSDVHRATTIPAQLEEISLNAEQDSISETAIVEERPGDFEEESVQSMIDLQEPSAAQPDDNLEDCNASVKPWQLKQAHHPSLSLDFNDVFSA